MKGVYVISQKDILEQPEKDDPIAISSFPIDSHDCQRVALEGEGVINEGTIFPVRRVPGQGYAYHVPYRSILPRGRVRQLARARRAVVYARGYLVAANRGDVDDYRTKHGHCRSSGRR